MAGEHVKNVFLNGSISGSNDYFFDISEFTQYDIFIDHPGTGTVKFYTTDDDRQTNSVTDTANMLLKSWTDYNPKDDAGVCVPTINCQIDTSPITARAGKSGGTFLRINIDATGTFYGVLYGKKEKY